MSIRQIQTRNALDLIAQMLFTSGINPLSQQIQRLVSEFFSANPAGLPLSMDKNIFVESFDSDPEMLNDFMAMMIVNLDTLYEACAQHVDQLMMLNTVLKNHLDRLRIKRKIVSQKIDDYLLGIYNSDGYFYSFSDDFSSVRNIDFGYTTAFVDTTAGIISLPALASQSRVVNSSGIIAPTITVKDKNGTDISFLSKTPFENALDGMTNTAWFIEVRLTEPKPIYAELTMPVFTQDKLMVSKIEITPHGVQPVQCGINIRTVRDNSIKSNRPFSHSIQTSSEKMVFVNDEATELDTIILQLAKTNFDYVENTRNGKSYVYIFGMKELLITEQVYDSTAIFVSEPFGIDDSFSSESSIDAVSLVVEDYVPTNSKLQYYIAPDNPDAETLSDFNWQKISPIGSEGEDTRIHFNGSFSHSYMVRKTKRSSNDLKLIDLNSTSTDLTKRNPTPAYLNGLDIYRITEFLEEPLMGSLQLEEGINTTKVFYTDLDENALVETFAFWKQKFDDNDFSVTYGETDSGHEFFYGATVGEDAKSVYVETYLFCDKEYPIFLKECRKSDPNSKLWDMKVFLNGKEIANMPVGTDKMSVPWKLTEGSNHIVLMINIPEISDLNPYPYMGTFNIMVADQLNNYGTIKLGNWTYVDLYKLQNNQTNDLKTFTIYNKELISRREPTNNFRLTFKTATDSAPSALRLRADLERSRNDARVSPVIDSYRVRFSYR